MEAIKHTEIKTEVEKLHGTMPNIDIAKKLEHEYIFGPLGKSEHYSIDELLAIVNEVELEKNPPIVVEEPAIEEPIVEEPLIP
jgi:hypothetical protein